MSFAPFQVQAGVKIAREGHICREVYLIERGEVMITRGDTPVAVIGRGGTFGEMSALGHALGPKGNHRDKTATALTDTEMVFITGARLRELCEDYDSLKQYLKQVVATRLRERESREADHDSRGRAQTLGLGSGGRKFRKASFYSHDDVCSTSERDTGSEKTVAQPHAITEPEAGAQDVASDASKQPPPPPSDMAAASDLAVADVRSSRRVTSPGPPHAGTPAPRTPSGSAGSSMRVLQGNGGGSTEVLAALSNMQTMLNVVRTGIDEMNAAQEDISDRVGHLEARLEEIIPHPRLS